MCASLSFSCAVADSFDVLQRANDFLLTSDTDVLLATLRLCIRPAQQWSSQHMDMATGFGISHARLLDLAQNWSVVTADSRPVDFVECLTSPSTEPKSPSTAEVTFQFYRKADPPASKAAEGKAGEKGKGKEKDGEAQPSASGSASVPNSAATATFATPAKSKGKEKGTAGASAEGLTTITITSAQISAADRPQDVLADVVEEHAIPAEYRLKLFHRIRLAMAIRDRNAKEQMGVIRLLALSLYMHTTDESTAMSKVFIYEPSLVAHLAELIHPEKDVSLDVQAAAFYALEGIGRYRGRISEVTSAVGVSVSHGVLMQVVRKMAKAFESADSHLPLDFVDAIFCFLSCLQLSAYAGALVVGAGIVPLLVDIAKNSHANHIAVVTRAVTSLDGLLYGFTSAFPLFTQAEGMKVFVNRVKEQVDRAISQHSMQETSTMKPSELLTGLLSHPAAGLLKALLRAIQRLLSSAGTMDSVRNLADSQLPSAIKLILQHKSIFGYQIYSLAINQMSTIIHSEPTSLAILQEAGLPAAFYDAIENDIEPAFDVIAAIPAALGALCLNEAGLVQLNERTAIKALFGIFTSEKHARVLRERDCASVLGGSLDELIRHQPTLKQTILEQGIALIERLHEVGKEWNPAPDRESFYRLSIPASGAAPEVEMGEAEGTAAKVDKGKGREVESEPVALEADKAQEKEKEAEGDKPGHPDNVPLLMMDVTCRVRS